MKNKVHAQSLIHAPVENIFNFITDPAKAPSILPGLIANTDIPDLPLKKGSTFHYKYQLFGVVLEGTWTVTGIAFPKVYTAKTDGDAASTWQYTLSDEDGVVLLELTVEYEPPRTVLERVKNSILLQITQNMSETYLEDLKSLFEYQGE